jgi:hypothetical protein
MRAKGFGTPSMPLSAAIGVALSAAIGVSKAFSPRKPHQ